MSESFDFPKVDRLTVGTVGPVGKRVFLLQARQGGDIVTLKLEKAQVAALSEYLGELLADLQRPGHLPEDLELEPPVEPLWVVGALGMTYDEPSDTVVLVAEEATEQDEDEDEDEDEDVGAVARFGASREQVAALAIRGTALVESGRPPCPLCGFPLDPSGHACPKANGNRPPVL